MADVAIGSTITFGLYPSNDRFRDVKGLLRAEFTEQFPVRNGPDAILRNSRAFQMRGENQAWSCFFLRRLRLAAIAATAPAIAAIAPPAGARPELIPSPETVET